MQTDGDGVTVATGQVIVLANAAEQEDVVIHAEPEEHREEQDRDPRFHHGRAVETEDVDQEALLENQHQQLQERTASTTGKSP